jgi:ferric-dicitrate binding protein FerR (iron transport regulator)
MNRDLNIEILAEKEVRGTLNPQERSELEDWLSADPLNRKEFQELTEILRLSEAGMESVDPKTDLMWAELQSSIDGEAATPARRSLRTRRIWAIAASVVLLCAVGYFLIQSNLIQNKSANALEYAASDQIKTVVLPDQSEVRLQPGSRLKLATEFNEDERRMVLEGEALFTVTRNEAKPFVVDAAGTQTKVLGTVFELKTDQSAGNVQLFVRSGKVSFAGEKSDQPSILTADMHAQYDSHSGEISVSTSKSAKWKVDESITEVVAQDQAIRELLPDLEKLFGVTLEIPENLLETHITGTFESSAEGDMIAALELILNGKFEKKDANYIFTPR